MKIITIRLKESITKAFHTVLVPNFIRAFTDFLQILNTSFI